MKNIILSAVVMVFVLVSCNHKNKQEETAVATIETTSQLYACSMHPEITGKKGDECSECGMELTEPVKATPENVVEPTSESKNGAGAFSLTEIQSNFANIKNAIAKNDTKQVAVAGKSLYEIFNKIDANSIDAKLRKDYLDIAESAKENAEHIGDNEGKLDHQKEHFKILSKDINDLTKLFDSAKK
jgi:hypothetical protein